MNFLGPRVSIALVTRAGTFETALVGQEVISLFYLLGLSRLSLRRRSFIFIPLVGCDRFFKPSFVALQRLVIPQVDVVLVRRQLARVGIINGLAHEPLVHVKNLLQMLLFAGQVHLLPEILQRIIVLTSQPYSDS